MLEGNLGLQLLISRRPRQSIKILKNQLLSTLPYIGKQFTISFDLLFAKWPKKGFESVMHFTLGQDASVYGDRAPALWVTNRKKLVVSMAITGNKNKWFEISGLRTSYWNNVTIKQLATTQVAPFKHMFEVHLNGKRAVYVLNQTPRKFRNIKVYVGDKWYPPLGVSSGGWIRNLNIMSGGETTAGQRQYPGISLSECSRKSS